MKSSAVAAGKRRSLLPAPKSFTVGTNVAASKTSEVSSRKVRESSSQSSTGLASGKRPTGLKVITSSAVGDSGNKSKASVSLGKLADNLVSKVPAGEVHSGSESSQAQLRKPSNLQRSAAATRKRPSSASSVLNRGVQELNKSSSLTKISPDSDNSAKRTSAASAGDQNTETKHNRLLRGNISASASHSASSGSKQRQLPRSAETAARKLKPPTKCVSVSTAQSESRLKVIDSAYSQAETASNAQTVISTSSDTKIPLPENIAAGATVVLPESSSVSSGEGGLATPLGLERDFSESSLSTVPVASVPDVLSIVMSFVPADDDYERIASSSGSLGILDDTDLLDTSLLSFDSGSAPSTTRTNDTEACCDQSENPPDEHTLLAVYLGSQQSPTASDSDPLRRIPTNEVNMPSLRPLSLTSNSSTDVGIVADCVVHVNESRHQQERPSSYMSTSSADTGMC